MAQCILDSCALVNLYAGWGDLDSLWALGHEWYVCEAVMREAQYVRDFDPAGAPILKRIDLQPYIDAGRLVLCRPQSPNEILANVEFAIELDDGEAQALALAQHRKLVLVTDEKPALKMAATLKIDVNTVTTPAVLKEWAELHADNESRMPEIVRRIAIGARYKAPRDCPLYEWWQKHLLDS